MFAFRVKIILIVASYFLGFPIFGFEPPQKPASKPLSQYEEMEELAEQFMQEQQQMLKEEEEKERMRAEDIAAQAKRQREEVVRKEIAEKERKEKEAERKRMEAEDIAAQARRKKEREEAQRKKEEQRRKEAQERKIQEHLQKILNILIESYVSYNPINVEYLSLETLKELLSMIERMCTADAAILAQRFNIGVNEMSNHILELAQHVKIEIEARKKPAEGKGQPSLKTILLNPSLDLMRLTFKSLQEKIDGIERIDMVPTEMVRWANELNMEIPKLVPTYKSLQRELRKTKDLFLAQAQEDLHKSQEEQKQEVAELKKSQELAAKEIPEETPAKVQEIKTKFPQFFEHIPKEYELKFLNAFEKIYAETRSIDVALEKLYKFKSDEMLVFRLIALGRALGYEASAPRGGYVFFRYKDITRPPELPAYLILESRLEKTKNPEERKKLAEELTRLAEELVQTYKIHLMPTDSIDQITMLLKIDKAIKNDPELNSLITVFKILINPYRQGDIIFPKVVFYSFGKENTQKMLNRLYKILDMPGMNLKPRYNARVTDLIWVAQGNGDHKMDNKEKKISYKAYYENPDGDRVYYKPDFTGKQQDYHLVHPETSKEIV